MSQSPSATGTKAWRDLLLAAILAAGIFAVFARALGCGFINLDDPYYVTRNPQVIAGLSLDGLRWAFTSVKPFAWCPLTRLSLQLDASLWWPDPKGFLLTNVLLHSANAALVFLALRALTGSRWRSLLAAVLFAVHPLRVESVAWITERKDVLSTFFGLLSMWCYAAYVHRPSATRYAAVALTFALSLMAKAMLVTLPFLFLVLDWWPLARWQSTGVRRLVGEKLPLVALAAASAFITIVRGDEIVGTAHGLEGLTRAGRIANATVSYILYLNKLFWPTGLALFYPHPLDAYVPSPGLAGWKVAGAALLLVSVSIAAFALRKRVPSLLAGWLWYLGVLMPVIGVVQSGRQGFADRFSYFPHIGIMMAICWAIPDLATKSARVAFTASVAIVVLALIALTEARLGVWQDPVRLWRDSLEATGPNLTALANLAELLADRGDNQGAVRCHRAALRLDPDDFDSHLNLGTALAQLEEFDEAAREIETALRINPREDGAICNLGMVEVARGDLARAAARFREALTVNPNSAQARGNLANVLAQQGKLPDAVREYTLAIRLEPRDASLYFNFGNVLSRLGKSADATVCFERAAALQPSSPQFRQALENSKRMMSPAPMLAPATASPEPGRRAP
jgi:Flp pilus assembly protein TadD